MVRLETLQLLSPSPFTIGTYAQSPRSQGGTRKRRRKLSS
jgi:hypothetical protein